MAESGRHFNVVVIGTGFGGTMTALTLARAMKKRAKGETILILERGTWWTTPVGTVQDKEVRAYDFLKRKKQPVQFWSSVEHFKGFIDIVLRCLRRKGNEDGLYDLTTFRKRGFLGLFGAENDGVSILRASGVGGGSLIYANVTIQPPDLVFDDERWPRSWDQATRNKFYDIARNAIGYGVVWAWNHWEEKHQPGTPRADPALQVNTGLSNIATRTARLDPHWLERTDPQTGRTVRYIDPARSTPNVHTNDLWIDRARVFQTQMSQLTNDFGTVDSSINDLTPEGTALEPNYPTDKPKNYCERQGRCILGCLPGARHTLNKQLMRAILGRVNPNNPDGDSADYDFIKLEALAEVDVIWARPEGGYEICYVQRNPNDPGRKTPHRVTADKVIVAAGCVGTSEILLRSKDRGTLPHLSDKLGFGFSTNGDFLGFLENTKERVSLTRGPVTTSFAHFHTPIAPKDGGPADPKKFHTVEDNGIPRPFSSLVGFGIPIIRKLTREGGNSPRIFVLFALGRWLVHRFWSYFLAFFRDARRRQEFFKSEDEYTANMMCVAAMGRAESKGQFRLGKGWGETPLRVSHEDGIPFHQDPIYKEIRDTLGMFAQKLTGRNDAEFLNPFLSDTFETLQAKSVALSHPLGGCCIAENADGGVVDDYGRVYDKTKSGERRFYEGLYVADASIIPTSLGVNPSLTISALALRIAEQIIQELDESEPMP